MATKVETNLIELTAGNVKEAMKGVKSSDLWQVPFEQLYIIPGYNVREHDEAYEAHIIGLMELIEGNGYDRDKPMSGYVIEVDGVSRIAVTAGHSRHEAVRRLREKGVEVLTIPVITKPRGTSMEDMTVDLITSNSGRPLTPFEVGTVIKRLIGYGWDEKKIGAKIGVTSGYVNDLLLLQGASKTIRDMVRTGKVSAGVAISAVKKHGTKAVAVLQEAVTTAKKAGKDKATAKHVAPTWRAAVKASGPDLFSCVKFVQADPAYAKMDAATKAFIDDILSKLPEMPASEE